MMILRVKFPVVLYDVRLSESMPEDFPTQFKRITIFSPFSSFVLDILFLFCFGLLSIRVFRLGFDK
ncbi:hypothetical protein HK096_003356, partial [Nowakowskiella sp. JEL0078]